MLESTSVTLNAVCEIRNSRERRGVSKGVGGERILIAAGVSGDDVLVVGSEKGTSEPGGCCDAIIFVFSHNNRFEVADWIID